MDDTTDELSESEPDWPAPTAELRKERDRVRPALGSANDSTDSEPARLLQTHETGGQL